MYFGRRLEGTEARAACGFSPGRPPSAAQQVIAASLGLPTSSGTADIRRAGDLGPAAARQARAGQHAR